MLIKTKSSAYFFSESIFMNPGTSNNVSLADLSDVQIQDIYEGMITGRLIVDSRDQLLEEFTKRLAKTGKISPDVTKDVTDKVKALEDSVKKTAQKIPSVEEVERLLTNLRKAREELDSNTLNVPDFVSRFRSEL